ncbi:MAG: glycoside hydrolase family 97 catalytic domain-containing protein [Bacteroidota bacterium]|nr:glycoside hydrolase family 97 catalytic domain-containing protein [Bacteroidota bacterium]MDP4205609.1 glycoside hydrolase family 97 catalytic domain-containing protein [Bacteroidota bacterium]
MKFYITLTVLLLMLFSGQTYAHKHKAHSHSKTTHQKSKSSHQKSKQSHHSHSRAVTEKSFSLLSPDGKIEIKITDDPDMKFGVFYQGKEIITPSPISMTFDNGTTAGIAPKFSRAEESENKEYIDPVVKNNDIRIEDSFNQLTFYSKANYNIIFRAYNDGIAYRFATAFTEPVKVLGEKATFSFPSDLKICFPTPDQLYSRKKEAFNYTSLSTIRRNASSVPALIRVSDSLKVMISEADVEDYPEMLWGANDSIPFSLHGNFTPYPTDTKQITNPNTSAPQNSVFIAQTKGTRQYPWRMIIISDRGTLVPESDMDFKLSEAEQIEDVSWIKTGEITYDLKNELQTYPIDFKSGVTDASCKKYIDAASANGIQCILLNEGWYNLNSNSGIAPSVNIEELTGYAKQKNVNLIAWVSWESIKDNLSSTLDQFRKWGIKGIKIDRIDRNDQWMVNYYQKIVNEAAKQELMVGFHGAYKPTGIHRTYPNIINIEEIPLSNKN